MATCIASTNLDSILVQFNLFDIFIALYLRWPGFLGLYARTAIRKTILPFQIEFVYSDCIRCVKRRLKVPYSIVNKIKTSLFEWKKGKLNKRQRLCDVQWDNGRRQKRKSEIQIRTKWTDESNQMIYLQTKFTLRIAFCSLVYNVKCKTLFDLLKSLWFW